MEQRCANLQSINIYIRAADCACQMMRIKLLRKLDLRTMIHDLRDLQSVMPARDLLVCKSLKTLIDVLSRGFNEYFIAAELSYHQNRLMVRFIH